MKKYNVTKKAPRALRNKTAFAVAVLSSVSLQNCAKLPSIFDRKNALFAVFEELVGAYSAIHGSKDEKERARIAQNVTLVYQGHIRTKFVPFGGESAVMRRD